MTKEKNTAKLYLKQNAYEKTHSCWSHLTQRNKLSICSLDRYGGLLETEVLEDI
jgi:hypothetical protein